MNLYGMKWSLVAGGVGVALAAAGCSRSAENSREWRPPQAIRVTAEKESISLFPSSFAWLASGGKDLGSGLLLREGDWVLVDDMVHIYRREDGQDLRLEATEGRLQIGRKTASLHLENDPPAWAWLGSAADAELASLRFVALKSEGIDAGRRSSLERLARCNPGVALMLEGPAAAGVLPLFRPRSLWLGSTKDEPDVGMRLRSQPQIEWLVVGHEMLDQLPPLPRLETLVFWGGNSPSAIADLRALPRLPALRKLGIMGAKFKSAADLGPVLQQLEELALWLNEELVELGALAGARNLRVLSLFGCNKVASLAPLRALSDLRWVSLPPTVTPADFADFAATHPRLEVLELIGCEQVKDLAPLASLKSLHGLVVSDPLPAVEVLRTLKGLRFAGLMFEKGKDHSAELAKIRAALPDAMVVPVQPFCLGSGWLLLLPAVMAAVMLRRLGSNHGGSN